MWVFSHLLKDPKWQQSRAVGLSVQSWVWLWERGFDAGLGLTHSHRKWRCRGHVKEGVKAGCVLGQDMRCPARDPSPAWVSPYWGQAPPYLQRIQGREAESRGRGCEDQCPKHPCKSQSLKKAAQLEKPSFSVINPVIHLMIDIQMHRHLCMCTLHYFCPILPLLFILTLRQSNTKQKSHH